MNVNPLDIFAGIVACIAVLGIVVLGVVERPVPTELSSFAGLSAGWLFRGSAQVLADRKAPPTP